MKKHAKYTLLATSLFAASCSTIQNPDAFDAMYAEAITAGDFIRNENVAKLVPPQTAIARNTCRYAHPKLLAKLRPARDQNKESSDEDASTRSVVITALLRAVFNAGREAFTALLDAATRESTVVTPVRTSFDMTKEFPRCFVITKNAGGKGQFIVEFALQESKTPGVFRLIPTYLNYGQASNQNLFNSGPRNIVVGANFLVPELRSDDVSKASTMSMSIVNLGEWNSGTSGYLNATAYVDENEPNVNLPGSWFNIVIPNGEAPINVGFTVTETTSGSAVAKIFAAALEASNLVDESTPAAEN